MEILVKVAQLILSLSILVVFHELGHFGFAKLFKTRVEKFYLFFNAWFSLVRFKKTDKGWIWQFGKSNNNEITENPERTEYGIGWLPLGGYVKIAGMIDESMDKEQMKLPPQPYEFRSKPAWQRLLIMIGGVSVNVVLAVFIYIFTLYAWGETYLPTANMKYGIMVDSVGLKMGLQNGDKIQTVNNKTVENYQQIYEELILNEPHSLQINRNGEPKEVVLTDEMVADLIDHAKPIFSPRIPFIIDGFAEKSEAQKSGMLVNDRVVGINGDSIQYFDEFRGLVNNYKNQDVTVTVLRGNERKDLKIKVSEAGTIGVAPNVTTADFFEVKTIDYSLISAVPAGIAKGGKEINSYLKQLKLIFTPKTEAYKSVGSFITIGKIFPGVWDWQAFWSLTAFLSIVLAVVNILPIPALDGGHVLFLLYEIIARRKPSEKFLEYAQYAGMVILLSLFVFAIGNDIFRHIIN